MQRPVRRRVRDIKKEWLTCAQPAAIADEGRRFVGDRVRVIEVRVEGLVLDAYLTARKRPRLEK